MGLSHGHERGVKAFINQEFHECEPADAREPEFRGTFFDSFKRNPCSESVLGRPRAGWAAVQISANSIMRAVRAG
jgi:hypothetical protein